MLDLQSGSRPAAGPKRLMHGRERRGPKERECKEQNVGVGVTTHSSKFIETCNPPGPTQRHPTAYQLPEQPTTPSLETGGVVVRRQVSLLAGAEVGPALGSRSVMRNVHRH
jgi:hypothetical protein